jgi:VWFA-related protein
LTAKALCALAAITLVSGPASAQDSPPLTSDFTETVQVRLVELRLLALDREEGPVTGLTPEDLELTVAGERREIAYLKPLLPPDDPERPLPRVRLGLDAAAVAEAASTVERAPRYYLLFLDLANEPPAKDSAVHEAIVRFLREEIEPDDRVGVVSYTGNLHLDLPFTDDPDRKAEAVSRAFDRARPSAGNTLRRVLSTMQTFESCNRVFDTPWLAGEELEELKRAGEDRPVADDSCVRQIAESYMADMYARGARFLDSLEAAVRFAGTVRGGATILALSHGVSLRPETEFLEAYQAVFGPLQTWKVRDSITNNDPNGPALDRLLRLGVEQGVTVNFLDPSTPPAGSRSARSRNLVAAATSPVETAYLAPRQDLRQIAGATGGVFVANTDVAGGLREVCMRERGRYVLGFYTERPLSERELLDVEVSANEGNVAVEAGRAFDVRSRSARWAPGTIVLGDARPAGEDGAARFVPNDMAANLSLHVRVLTSDGRHLADRYDFFRHSYAADRPTTGKPLVLAVRGWLEAEPGDYRLEAVFRNPQRGREVMILHEIAVPPPGADPVGLD